MDARRVVLVLIVAGAVWNSSPVAAQSWSSNNSAAPASTYNRYEQPGAPTAPSITQRTQSAFTDTGTAVRDGVEAGIRAAEQGYNNATGQATTSFSAPATTNPTTSAPRSAVSSPWPNTSAASSAPPPAPSWASNASNTPPAPTTRTVAPTVTPIDGGWTSIGNAVAAPPLLIPQPPTTTSNFGLSNQTTGTRTATNASAVTSNEIQPLHSVLADPSRPPAPATSSTSTAPPASSPAAIGPPDNWATGWNDNATAPTATIGAGTRTSPAGTTAPAVSGSTVSKASDGWPDSNPWSQPSQPSLGAANGAVSANRPAPNAAPTNTQFPTNTSQPNGQFAGQTSFQSPGGQQAGSFNMAGTNNPMGGTLPPIERGQTKVATTEPQPWMPLIASVLVLAGSLAANLYLGVSYLDARQKYQSLVRKTADTFRRVKAVAA